MKRLIGLRARFVKSDSILLVLLLLTGSNLAANNEYLLHEGITTADWQKINQQIVASDYSDARSSRGSSINRAYLKASNTDPNDQFGWSVAVSGNTVVVGAPFESGNSEGVGGDQANNDLTNAGAAYVFVRSDDGWTQQAYLKASNTDFADRFGYSVAISGDTIVVGAITEDSDTNFVNGDQSNNDADEAGAVYVFVRTAGLWTQEAYLKASNSRRGDQFGFSVSVSGDIVVVGAPFNDRFAPSSGAAYVFQRQNGFIPTWSEQAFLKASNAGLADVFGLAVAVSGETIVVGAGLEDSSSMGVNGEQFNNQAHNSGAAYVFEKRDQNWNQVAYLKSSNTDIDDRFGEAVAISDDMIAVGALGESSDSNRVDGNQENNDAPFAGAVYIFERLAGTWVQQAYIKASNSNRIDQFGYSVSLSENSLLVGAIGEDSSTDKVNGDQFDNSAVGAGAAYFFLNEGGRWKQQAYIKATNSESADRFGWSVAVSENTFLIGSSEEDSSAVGIGGDEHNNDAVLAGAAYIFPLRLLTLPKPQSVPLIDRWGVLTLLLAVMAFAVWAFRTERVIKELN